VPIPESKNVKVAVPVAGGVLCPRFGQSEGFAIVHILNGQINTWELQTPPPGESGELPRWLTQFGVDLIIAGDMGEQTQGFFTARGIDVITGAPRRDLPALIHDYLAGDLARGRPGGDH